MLGSCASNSNRSSRNTAAGTVGEEEEGGGRGRGGGGGGGRRREGGGGGGKGGEEEGGGGGGGGGEGEGGEEEEGGSGVERKSARVTTVSSSSSSSSSSGEAMDTIKTISPQKLASLVKSKTDKALIIDSRTFCEFNTSHVLNSINVWSSKIRKKRLQQDSISVHDYLQQACQVSELHASLDIIVYDQNAPSLSAIPQDSFLHVLLNKLGRAFPSVFLLSGGFLEFQASFPELCEDSSKKCTPLTSQSQPCMPVANVGPTRILPFLYLGSQHDANNRQLLSDHNILYELNVSVSCPKPDFVQDSHFMRIPVNDNFSEKLLPYFNEAFHFIDKVRESGGCVLVHCLAGISRSATVAIAYVMKHLRLPFEEAYIYVKTRRPTISPNINFVGQLAELDRQLKRDASPRDPTSAPVLFRTHETLLSSSGSSSLSSASSFTSSLLEKHACASIQNVPKSLSLNLKTTLEAVPASPSSSPHSPAMSPCTALERLSFASALDELRDDGLPATPKCPSPVTPLTCLHPSPPTAVVMRDSTSSPLFSFRRYGSFSNPSSPAFNSFFKNKEVSSRTSSDHKQETNISTIQESFTCSDNANSTSRSNNSYYSSATINIGASETGVRKESVRGDSKQSPLTTTVTRQGRDREGRQVSVCVIDVKREDAPVKYVRSEPLVVKETQVIATPCHTKPEVRSVLEVQLEDGRQKEEHFIKPEETRKTVDCKTSWKQIEKSQTFKESASKAEAHRSPDETSQRPREVIVPIHVAGSHEGRPKVLELSVPLNQQQQRKPQFYYPIPATAACSSTVPSSGVWLPGSPKEGTVAEPEGITPNSPSSSGVQQSDSGIIVEEGTREPPPSPQRLPRCYSSSETHLNTRRLLEHRNPDFTARKCSSYDEVGRAWPQNIAIHNQQNQQGVNREGSTWLCPWELARSDSVSTSGFGSEISDTDLLHDDAHSTITQDDALGPYDAVFADVFPGDQSAPKQQQPTTPKTPRPASLPGVTGTYFSHFERTTDTNLDMGTSTVELRRGNRGRMGVEKKDSGYYSFLTEHPPVSPRTMGEGVRHTTNIPWPKERPRNLQLQVSSVTITPPNESPKTIVSVASSHTPVQTSTTESKISPEKRMTPEKRKSRGSSTEENEEKRRSCEVESHEWTPPRQSLNIGAGVRMAQILRGVEQLLDSEMRELKQRTAAMSSRLRFLGRSDPSSSSSGIGSPRSSSSSSSSSGISSCGSKSPKVHTHIIVTTLRDDDQPDTRDTSCKKKLISPSKESEPSCNVGSTRARSEPPFSGEEGLYRARSCPGLPRSTESTEGNETVSALVSDLQLVRLRGSRPQSSNDKTVNRYSCGALDVHQPVATSAFESCPDFGNLRSCVREGDSMHSSSSSLSSTHSSFTRLLQVS